MIFRYFYDLFQLFYYKILNYRVFNGNGLYFNGYHYFQNIPTLHALTRFNTLMDTSFFMGLGGGMLINYCFRVSLLQKSLNNPHCSKGFKMYLKSLLKFQEKILTQSGISKLAVVMARKLGLKIFNKI